MVHIPSTMRTRSVGDELVGLRKAAGYNAREFSHKLGWENSRLSRIENGKYRTSEVDVTQYVTMLGQPRSVLDHLLTMLRQCDDHYVVQPHGVRLVDELHTLIRNETTARSIHSVESVYVPGLLQTRDYIHALLASCGTPANQLDDFAKTRLDRQCVFNRPMQPDCIFYIHEFALRLLVGSRRVMHDQALHLARMASASRVSIRIVPLDRGPNCGLTTAFSLMTFADEQLPVVGVNLINATLFLDDHGSVAAHYDVLADLDRIALDREQSRAWLMTLANEYDRPSA